MRRAFAPHMGNAFVGRWCMYYGSCGVCQPGTRLGAIRHAGLTALTPLSEPLSCSTSFLAQSHFGCDKAYSAGGKWVQVPHGTSACPRPEVDRLRARLTRTRSPYMRHSGRPA